MQNEHNTIFTNIFQKTPALVGQILKYHRMDGEHRSGSLNPLFELLCYAVLIQRVFATSAVRTAPSCSPKHYR